MNIQYIHPADQLVMFLQRIYDKRLTTMSGGNLSIRDDDGNIWITPAGVDKGTLTRRDIICVKPDGRSTSPCIRCAATCTPCSMRTRPRWSRSPSCASARAST